MREGLSCGTLTTIVSHQRDSPSRPASTIHCARHRLNQSAHHIFLQILTPHCSRRNQEVHLVGDEPLFKLQQQQDVEQLQRPQMQTFFQKIIHFIEGNSPRDTNISSIKKSDQTIHLMNTNRTHFPESITRWWTPMTCADTLPQTALRELTITASRITLKGLYSY